MLGSLYGITFDPPIKNLSATNPWLPLLSPQQIVEINGAFQQFDRNADGHIDVTEIQAVMQNLGFPKTLEEAQQIASSVDADNNGTIEFDEFVRMMANRMLKSDGTTELQMAFEVLFEQHVDEHGWLQVATIRQVLTQIGANQLSDAEVDRMVRELGGAVDGAVPFSKFREHHCWDLCLPGGDVVSLRHGSSSTEAPAEGTPAAVAAPPAAAPPPPPDYRSVAHAPSAAAYTLPPVAPPPAYAGHAAAAPPASAEPIAAPAPGADYDRELTTRSAVDDAQPPPDT